MKYKVIVWWKSGTVEEVQCETLTSAKMCIETFSKQYNVQMIGLRELVNGKWEVK